MEKDELATVIRFPTERIGRRVIKTSKNFIARTSAHEALYFLAHGVSSKRFDASLITYLVSEGWLRLQHLKDGPFDWRLSPAGERQLARLEATRPRRRR